MLTLLSARGAAPRGLGTGHIMAMTSQAARTLEWSPEEQKRAAVGYLQEAWNEALLDGIDGDCLAQTCLFAALAELVTTYGEEATGRFAEGLAARVRNGEFSIALPKQ
jgi:hypothetical protein